MNFVHENCNGYQNLTNISMKHIIETKHILLFVAFHFFTIVLNAQTQGHNILLDSVITRIDRQLEIYPQEKIYVHNDKAVYLTGETVWFRIHLVDAFTHRYDTTSIYVYGELVDPEGKIADRVKIIRKNGIYSGYFNLAENLAEGKYTLCFHTKYMENLGENYFFKRTIDIVNPLSNVCRIEPNFEYVDNNKIKIDLHFTQSSSNQPFIPEKLQIGKSKNALKDETVNKNGVLSIELSDNNKPANFLYVDYKYNGKKQKQYIQIPSLSTDYDIQILPEGGKLLYGVENRVAYKAVNTNGMGEDVSLTLMEEGGDTILNSTSVHKGMGVFNFKPNREKKYTLRSINSNNIIKNINLTPKIEEGSSLSVNRLSELITTKINKSNLHTSEVLYLIIHSKGNVLYLNEVEEGKTSISFKKAELPSGIINFLLLDAALKPISERLMFNRNLSLEPDVAFNTNKSSYKKRELVKARLLLVDKQKNKLNGNVSVSVIDNNDVKPDTIQNIVSALLFSSELGGTIESPSMYIEDNRKSENLLDLLMMTHGWRRYDLSKTLQGNIIYPVIPIEQTHIISGQAKKGYIFDKKVKNIDINIFTLNPFSNETYQTDEEGRFAIGGYDLPDSAQYTVRALDRKTKENLDITLNEEQVSDKRHPLIYNNKFISLTPKRKMNDYIGKADMKYIQEKGIRTIDLAEVEIIGRSRKIQTDSKYSIGFGSIYTREHIARYDQRDISMLLRSLGLYLTMDEFGAYTGQISVRPQAAPALVLVNDIKDTDILTSGLHPEDIEDIEILKDLAATAAIGHEANAGAILITTRKDRKDNNKKYNYVSFIPLGYQKSADFYAPKYGTKDKIDLTIPDLRTTIHWQPALDIVNGVGEIEFYTSDSPTEYSVVIEGITDKGIPFYDTQSIRVIE